MSESVQLVNAKYNGYIIGKCHGIEMIFDAKGRVNVSKVLLNCHNERLKIYNDKIAELEENDDAYEKETIRKPAKKELSHWTALQNSKSFMHKIATKHGLEIDDVYYIATSLPPDLSGTYVHHDIAVHIFAWGSKEFASHLSDIVNEWKKVEGNEARYYSFIDDMKRDLDCNDNAEAQVRDRLAKKLKGEIEVKCPAGRIDIVTAKEIIEVKKYNNWTNAIGQIAQYWIYNKDKRPRIHIFDIPKGASLGEMVEVCARFDIGLSFEEGNDEDDEDDEEI